MSRFQALKQQHQQGTKTFSLEHRTDTGNSGDITAATTSAYGASLKAIQHSLFGAKVSPKVNDEESLQKKKEKQNQVRNLASNKNDPRFGILNAYVISIKDPSTFKNKSGGGGSGSGGGGGATNAGSMVKGSTSSAPGVSKASLVMWVAICDIDKVPIEKFVDESHHPNENTTTTTTTDTIPGCGRLMERTVSGCIKLKYAVEGKPDPNSTKKKIWSCVPLGEGESFKLRKGDVAMVSIWEGGAGIKEGHVIQLTNVKLTREMKSIPTLDSSSRWVSVAKYYFNCTISSSPSDWNDLPKATQLKHLFSMQGRQPPSLPKLFKMLQNHPQSSFGCPILPSSDKSNQQQASIEETNLKKVASDGGDDNVKDATHPKRQLQWMSGITPSILITINPPSAVDGKIIPTRDEYDKSYNRILKAAKSTQGDEEKRGGKKVSEPKVYTEEEIRQVEEDFALVCRTGTTYETEYPSLVSDLKVIPQQKEKEPYLKMPLNITSISWGSPRSCLDPKFRCPVLAPHSETDIASGLISSLCIPDGDAAAANVQNEVKKEIWYYDFQRNVIVTALYENQLKTLGPTSLDDIVAIMTSYQIPFTLLLGLNLKETSENPTNSDLLRSTTPHATEESRWIKLTNEKMVQEYARLSKSNKWFYKDGVLTGTPQVAVFHIAQFLEDYAITVPPALMKEIWEMKVAAANSSKSRVSIEDKNHFAYPNEEGYVFLSAMKVHPDDLLKEEGKDYKFYALVCFGETLMSAEVISQVRTKNKLEAITKKTRDFVLNGIGEEEVVKTELRDYISECTARIFYYAVDANVTKDCKSLAKRVFKEQVMFMKEKLGVHNNVAVVANSTTNTTVTTIESGGGDDDDDDDDDDDKTKEVEEEKEVSSPSSSPPQRDSLKQQPNSDDGDDTDVIDDEEGGDIEDVVGSSQSFGTSNTKKRSHSTALKERGFKKTNSHSNKRHKWDSK